jgi:cytochrome c oxidase assembly protein subunit 11
VISPRLRTALIAAGAVVGMGGLGFASVPIYRTFCQVTGYGGTTQRGQAAPGGVGQKVTIAFDANVNPGLNWSFRPENPQDVVDIGARDMAFFLATNKSAQPLTGTAAFNVVPEQAGKYFTKIQCFCFTQQTLQPGETVRMPVIFFVDPKIHEDADTRDVRKITLSYTFYPVGKAPPAK